MSSVISIWNTFKRDLTDGAIHMLVFLLMCASLFILLTKNNMKFELDTKWELSYNFGMTFAMYLIYMNGFIILLSVLLKITSSYLSYSIDKLVLFTSWFPVHILMYFGIQSIIFDNTEIFVYYLKKIASENMDSFLGYLGIFPIFVIIAISADSLLNITSMLRGKLDKYFYN